MEQCFSVTLVCQYLRVALNCQPFCKGIVTILRIETPQPFLISSPEYAVAQSKPRIIHHFPSLGGANRFHIAASIGQHAFGIPERQAQQIPLGTKISSNPPLITVQKVEKNPRRSKDQPRKKGKRNQKHQPEIVGILLKDP